MFGVTSTLRHDKNKALALSQVKTLAFIFNVAKSYAKLRITFFLHFVLIQNEAKDQERKITRFAQTAFRSEIRSL